MTLLLILGFWVPHVTGLLWLTSVTVSLLVYIFIMENIMRLIVNFTTSQQSRVRNYRFLFIIKYVSNINQEQKETVKSFVVPESIKKGYIKNSVEKIKKKHS